MILPNWMEANVHVLSKSWQVTANQFLISSRLKGAEELRILCMAFFASIDIELT